LNDMKALEMYPHRMGRVAQPAVSERICCEQVAKLVVHMGLSYRCKQRYASTPSQGQQPHQRRRQPPPGRELAEAALCYGQPSEVPSLHHAGDREHDDTDGVGAAPLRILTEHHDGGREHDGTDCCLAEHEHESSQTSLLGSICVPGS